MLKYGRGLNREIVAGVNSGVISEPFSTSDIRKFIGEKRWSPEPTEAYVNSALADGASEYHSTTYKKYFSSLGNGLYEIREQFRGHDWL